MDFDHYINSLFKTGKASLKNSFEYHKKLEKEIQKKHLTGIRKKTDFHFLHTLEFHALIGLLSFFWFPLFYVLIGMFLHSILDIIDMVKKDRLYLREFFFFNWIRKILKRN